jgi:hypothetical protein
MTRTLVVPALTASLCLAGAAIAAGEPGFRVRADFSAPLNADTGWAAGPNESTTVTVDRPFRLRFEVEPSGSGARPGGLQLEYRRNRGDWSPVEAHDFPYPQREIEIDFTGSSPGAKPEGWRTVAGNDANITVVEDGDLKVMRVQADVERLIGLYSPPWELNEFSFAAEYRVPAVGNGRVGIVFGYVDADNYWCVQMDTDAGVIRVSRFIDGTESLVARRSAGLVAGAWQQIEVKVETGMLEVNFGDDALQFSEPVGDSVPPSDLGFLTPARGRVDFRSFAIEGRPSSPSVSIVSTGAYSHGDPTGDLLRGATSPFAAGAGVSLSARTPPWNASGRHGEFEWPLVIRRFADRAITSEDGDTFEFRMTDGRGNPINRSSIPSLTLEVPAFHLGGTFVETPGRIGPWQAANGDLYFVMEPTESDNLFMVVKSSDGGRSWREVDGSNRPKTGDLESVDGRLVDGTIHMIHQVTGATFHHAFRTSDHPTHADTWAVTDELATKVIARVQMASQAVRADGSMVAFHLGNTIGYAVRSPDGLWSDEIVIGGNDGVPRLAGPQAVLGADDQVHLGYYREDGTIWYRRLLADGTLTQAHQLATGADTTEDDFGSVLPLVYIPQTDTTVIIYRLADGSLWERRITGDELPTAAVQVTAGPVVRNAVDSQQAGADAVADGVTVRVLFIDATDRNIYSTHDAGGWQPPTLEVDGIDGGWVRGSVYRRPDGVKVYGYAYDSGSQGGAGFNRFAEKVLDAH